MKPTILFVTEIKPYPLYGGMYIHIYNVLESLTLYYNVIVLSPPVEETCPLQAQVVAWYALPAYPIGLRAKAQNGLYLLRPRPTWRCALTEILQRHRPDGVWFTYGHWGQYAPFVQQHGAFAIMLTQNIQSELTRQRAATMPVGPLKSLTRWRAWAEAYHEHKLFRNFDRVISLTEIDRRYHARFVGDERSMLLPGFIQEETYLSAQPIQRAEQVVILTGSFSSFQNAQGTRWFIQEIWPQIQAALPGVCLQLVGRGATQLPSAILDNPAVVAIDGVPDIMPYLRRATVAVVPILHGSGMRFKILEAMACNIPVVSTTLGAQGIAVKDGESIMLADDPITFVQAILTLLQDCHKREQLAQRGLALLRQHYTVAVNRERIQRLVEECLC